jgi:hypothetical protein
MNAPIMVTWDAEAEVFHPLPHFIKRCNATFVDTMRYKMEITEERSTASHSHFFAALNEAWANLPESQADRFPTSEHLRKWALIRAGYSDQRQIVCASKAEALRMRAFIAPIDEYAIVTVNEAVVTVFTAKSQSYKAMGRREFNDSKSKVLDIVAELIGVTSRELEKAEAA